MTDDPYGHWMGTPMDESDIDDMLLAHDWGTLALATDDVPYSIPMTYGFDGDDVYFGFIDDKPRNEKFSYLGEGKPARLLVMDIEAKFDWRTVAVSGPIRSLSHGSSHWETMLDVLGENTWFASDYDRVRVVEKIHGWRMVPETKVGRHIDSE